MSKESVHKELVDLAVSRFGALYIAINIAGVYHFAPLEQQDSRHIDDMVDLNFKGIVYSLRHQLPAIGKFSSPSEWGYIINNSSAGTKPSSGLADMGGIVYSMTKVAVDQAVFLGAAAGRAHHVKVNGVASGPIFTPGLVNTGIPDKRTVDAMAANGTLLQRSGTEEDIANAVLFLVGKSADYIDGVVLHVDGGMYVK